MEIRGDTHAYKICSPIVMFLKHQRVSSCVCFTKTTGSKPSCCRLDDWDESKISSRSSSMNESILDFTIYSISFPPQKQ